MRKMLAYVLKKTVCISMLIYMCASVCELDTDRLTVYMNTILLRYWSA